MKAERPPGRARHKRVWLMQRNYSVVDVNAADIETGLAQVLDRFEQIIAAKLSP